MCHYQGLYVKLLSNFVGRDSGAAPSAPYNELEDAVVMKGIPFNKGNPYKVPGLIEAENYDDGGKDASVFTSKQGQSQTRRGNAYRMAPGDAGVPAVDFEYCSEGGWNIFDIRANDWFHYTVDVEKDGLYDIVARVGSAVDTASFHITVDGEDVSGLLAVPNTGYQKWDNVIVKDVPLDAGQRLIRVYFDTPGASANYYAINMSGAAVKIVSPVNVTTYLGIAPVLPGTVTAELDDGSTAQLPVTWDAVDPDDYAQLGEFTVGGATYNELSVTATVTVIDGIAGIEPVIRTASIGRAPALPAAVTVIYLDGSSGASAVEWDAIDPGNYAKLGKYTICGTVELTDIPAIVYVDVKAYLTGTPFGSATNGDAWETFDKAFDGNINSSFVSQTGNGRYVGLDLGAGNEKAISLIRFYVPAGYESVLNDAVIQGSNTSATGGLVEIGRFPAAVAAGWNSVEITGNDEWRFIRVDKPNNNFRMNIAELEIYAQEVCPADGGAYIISYTAPTCTADGEYKYECPECGHTFWRYETGTAPGHDLVEFTREDGYKVLRCTRCGWETDIPVKVTYTVSFRVFDGYYSIGYTQQVEEGRPIDWDAVQGGYPFYGGKAWDDVEMWLYDETGNPYWDMDAPVTGDLTLVPKFKPEPEWETVTVPPTCTLEGYTYDHHIPTGGKWYYDYVPALGHDFAEFTRDDGYKVLQCARCGWETDIPAAAVNYTVTYMNFFGGITEVFTVPEGDIITLPDESDFADTIKWGYSYRQQEGLAFTGGWREWYGGFWTPYTDIAGGAITITRDITLMPVAS
jgi:uncharacterized C2H2 Zn-finger protein